MTCSDWSLLMISDITFYDTFRAPSRINFVVVRFQGFSIVIFKPIVLLQFHKQCLVCILVLHHVFAIHENLYFYVKYFN